jgi:hypothetical protein
MPLTKLQRKPKGDTEVLISNATESENSIVASAPVAATTTTRWQRFSAFCKRKKLGWWFLGFLVFVILAVVIAGLVLYFFYWVGIPTLVVGGIQKPTSTTTNNAKIDLGGGVRAPSITMMINLNIYIENPNKLELPFSMVRIYGYHPSLPNLLIANATVYDVILGKQSSTNLTVPMFVYFNYGDDPTYAIAKDMIQSCTVVSGATKPAKQLSLDVAVDATFRIFGAIQIEMPRITALPSFDCPFAIKQAITLNDGTKIDLSSIDWVALSKGSLSSITSKQ